MTPQPQQEYIITEDMIAAWRTGCVNWRDKNPDSLCYGCSFKGSGGREGCCNFNDDEMQKIFQSRPHTSTPDCCSVEECNNQITKAARKACNATLDKLYDKANQRQMDVETEDGTIIEVIEKGEVLGWIESLWSES